MQSTATIKGTYSMEVEPEEYDALVDFLAEPKPIQFSDKAEKAIRKRLEYLERTRGV